MHELSITNAILTTVLRHARRERAGKVHRVLLVVSELSDLKAFWLQRYFSELARGTVAEDARLVVESQAPEFTCNACGTTFALSLRGIEQVSCASCGSVDCTLVRGVDYLVDEIEVS